LLLTSLVITLSACSNTASQSDGEVSFSEMLERDFIAEGPATHERLIQQDEAQVKCSEYPLSFADEELTQFKEAQLKTVQYPTDGNYLGDWKEGQAIALNSKGMQYSDRVGGVNGGNCFACHQMTKKEIAYGNVGPSLNQYRQTRGSNDRVIKYTWEKIYNAQSHKACSSMPRFGYSGILTEQQLKDVMAFLLSPDSPVNE